ncbi:MAG: tetratricopeptide repeat protein [Bacteroidales bacterium]|nr:tetratricopeptide repeat protein [Bacteroidales bacterium]
MKSHHFIVVVLVFMFIGVLSGYAQQTAEQLYQSGLYKEEIKGELDAAIKIYETIINQYPENRSVAAKALLHFGICKERLGMKEAQKAYERVVSDYADQSEIVAQARVRLVALGGSGGTSGTGGLVTRRVLTDASGVDGVLTADGKYIRYLDWGTGEVVQFEVVSGQTSRIKNKGPWGERENYVEGYVFSRDRKQIAYDRYTMEGKPQLRIRNLDCSDLRTIYNESSTLPFDWSPDAGSILALRGIITDNVNELLLISTKDSSVRVLKKIESGPYVLTRASFSPDGRYVAFSMVNEGNPPQGDVNLMTVDGRNEVVVAGHPAEDELLAWTPDGKSLLFLSDRSGTMDIWTVHITGGKQQGEPELLKKDFGRGSKFLGFAPDGSLYYKTVTPLGHLYFGEVDLETGKVLVPPTPVTTRLNGPPSRIIWSPDGGSLLYVSGGRAMGNGNNNLTIRSAKTGEERFLSTRLRKVWDIYWAPDSRTILAWGMTVKENALFRIDSETSGITKLADGRWAPRLSPDGKTMVYMGKGGITRRNLDTGEESVGVKVGTEVLHSYGDLSPDCQEAVFQEKGTVYTVPLNGGERREIFRGLAHYSVLRWTRDGRYIIAQALDDTTGGFLGISEIWRIPVQGGTPLKLDLSVPKMDFFALHPDNRHYAFSVNDGTKEELWVMENFLPK